MTVKKVTPHGDLSWYIKWIASAFILAAIMIRAADYSHFLDLALGFVGMSLWGVVGFMWHDRSLIILNGVSAALLAVGLLEYIK